MGEGYAKVPRRGACYRAAMKRIGQAPNIAIAQLWVDMLRDQGIDANMQRYFLNGAAGYQGYFCFLVISVDFST
ncbi:MAG: hypothetical protein EAZ80_00395 [Runella slithyformis]|nr:MAG: hypothetical protein EAZ80_00395 [Runella slithyformis]